MRQRGRVEEDCESDGQILHVDLLHHGFPNEHPHHWQGLLTSDSMNSSIKGLFCVL